MVEPQAEPPLEGGECGDVWDDPKLARGTLAKEWEKVSALRQRMHDPDFPYLTRWLANKEGVKAIGVPSVKSMALNSTVLETIAKWYCPVQTCPKALPIDILRREVGFFAKDSTSVLPGSLCKFVQTILTKHNGKLACLNQGTTQNLSMMIFWVYPPEGVNFSGVDRQIQWPSEVPHGCGGS